MNQRRPRVSKVIRFWPPWKKTYSAKFFLFKKFVITWDRRWIFFELTTSNSFGYASCPYNIDPYCYPYITWGLHIDFDHTIQFFVGSHDDSNLPKVGILVEATSIGHHKDQLVTFYSFLSLSVAWLVHVLVVSVLSHGDVLA